MNQTPDEQQLEDGSEKSDLPTDVEAEELSPEESGGEEEYVYIQKHDDPHLVPDEDPGGLNLFLWASYVVIFVWSVWYVLQYIHVWR